MLPLVLYDADCGFCASSITALQGPVFRAQIHPVAWQGADLAALNLTAEQCQARLHVVDGGDVFAGAAAIARILRSARQPWPLAGRVVAVPGIAWLSERVYDFVARHRHQLPGGSAACRLASR